VRCGEQIFSFKFSCFCYPYQQIFLRCSLGGASGPTSTKPAQNLLYMCPHTNKCTRICVSSSYFICIYASGPTSPHPYESGIFILVQKNQEYHKRKFLLYGTLKTTYQIYHSEQEKQKRKSKFFYRDNFVIP
jgi:hypothetical protein